MVAGAAGARRSPGLVVVLEDAGAAGRLAGDAARPSLAAGVAAAVAGGMTETGVWASAQVGLMPYSSSGGASRTVTVRASAATPGSTRISPSSASLAMAADASAGRRPAPRPTSAARVSMGVPGIWRATRCLSSLPAGLSGSGNKASVRSSSIVPWGR
jgi:hypothetical protein